MKYTILFIVILGVSGCARLADPPQVKQVVPWIIDHYWYIENVDRNKACLISKLNITEFVNIETMEWNWEFPNRAIVSGNITVKYSDGDSVIWNNGELIKSGLGKAIFLQ